MTTLLLNFMVVLVLMSNFDVGCVLLIFVCCRVLLLMEKGHGELVVGFMNVVVMGIWILHLLFLELQVKDMSLRETRMQFKTSKVRQLYFHCVTRA
jgi:cell division protein FtsW (lipid II flippase)